MSAGILRSSAQRHSLKRRRLTQVVHMPCSVAPIIGDYKRSVHSLDLPLNYIHSFPLRSFYFSIYLFFRSRSDLSWRHLPLLCFHPTFHPTYVLTATHMKISGTIPLLLNITACLAMPIGPNPLLPSSFDHLPNTATCVLELSAVTKLYLLTLSRCDGFTCLEGFLQPGPAR